MGAPEILTRTYFEPRYSTFLDNLANLTNPSRCKPPFVIPGCGHLMQLENPKELQWK